MVKKLLAIVEQGGYQNFTELYKKCGFQVTMVHNMRKAMAIVRKEKPDIIVAEFNYQSDFRDRTSTLESLLATVERIQAGVENIQIRVIVFYEKEYAHQLEKLQSMFTNFDPVCYPIDAAALESKICNAGIVG